MTAEARTEGFAGWAVLELMGHRRLGGFCCETRIAGAEMIRIDIPWKDPSKGNRLTQFYGGGSIYCLTPCDEATAREAAGWSEPREYTTAQLTSGTLADEDPEDEGSLGSAYEDDAE